MTNPLNPFDIAVPAYVDPAVTSAVTTLTAKITTFAGKQMADATARDLAQLVERLRVLGA